MKSLVEGMRSLLYLNAKCADLKATATSDEEREKYSDLIEVFTPIVKGYVTDKALEVCSHGVQVFGGYGYIKELPVEQLMRDSRIFMIYEGTNGIQAMDLLGRKLSMKNGKSFGYFLDMMEETVTEAKEIEGVETLAMKMETAMEKFKTTAEIIGKRARSTEVLNAYSFAHPFLEVTGDITMAWMLLWRASVAAPKLVKKTGGLDSEVVAAKAVKNKEVAYYAGQIKTAAFFINTLLPSALAKMDAIVEGETAVEEIPEASFGSK